MILIERSPRVAAVWRWLIDATADDVLSLPDVPEGGTTDDIDAPQGARDLVGFWCNSGAASPRKSPSKWAAFDGHNWGGWIRARDRVAADVARIKHWQIIEGDYSDAPDVDATWFVDPPYQTSAGRHYPFDAVDFDHLGAWVMARRGQVIACDQKGATWLAWNHSLVIKATSGHGRAGSSSEVVYHRNEAQPCLF